MLSKLKQHLYFPIASYFRFFAGIRLKLWNPRIIVVTGSNGKTSLLHLLEAQIGEQAHFSHHANSSYGIPFDILGLHRKTLHISEWIGFILRAPFQVFSPMPNQKVYVVEADADRPYEGKFLAELLKPEVVLWVSAGRTHSMNFDHLVSEGKFKNVEEAIAYEYGYFLEYCQKVAVIDGDSDLEIAQTSRSNATVKLITKKEYLKKYAVEKEGTEFTIKDKHFIFKSLLPEELFLSIAMCQETVDYLGLQFDLKFSKFRLPPGRGSVFSGIKDTVLIDSTYNGNLSSIKAVLNMFNNFPVKKKWVVVGDMKELGKEEQEEHESLAHVLNAMDLEKVILVGKLVKQYTLPLIKENSTSVGFDKSPDALQYLQDNIQGGEAILFKGSQSIYLEGLIEPLLKNKDEVSQLPRQEQFWKLQRKQLGFH